jgi:hypothetical protein
VRSRAESRAEQGRVCGPLGGAPTRPRPYKGAVRSGASVLSELEVKADVSLSRATPHDRVNSARG